MHNQLIWYSFCYIHHLLSTQHNTALHHILQFPSSSLLSSHPMHSPLPTTHQHTYLIDPLPTYILPKIPPLLLPRLPTPPIKTQPPHHRHIIRPIQIRDPLALIAMRILHPRWHTEGIAGRPCNFMTANGAVSGARDNVVDAGGDFASYGGGGVWWDEFGCGTECQGD